MLLRSPGVAPAEATDVLQFLRSLLATEGLIRSTDFPIVDVFSMGLCHEGKYRTLSIWVFATSRTTMSPPELLSDRLLFAMTVLCVARREREGNCAKSDESAPSTAYPFDGRNNREFEILTYSLLPEVNEAVVIDQPSRSTESAVRLYSSINSECSGSGSYIISLMMTDCGSNFFSARTTTELFDVR